MLYSDWEMEPGFDFFMEHITYDKTVGMEESHFHNYLELTLVHSGEILYRFETREIVAKKGDLVIVNHLEPHNVKGTDYFSEITVFGFRPEFIWNGENEVDYRYIENFFNSDEIFTNHVKAEEPYNAKIKLIIEEISAEYRRKEDGYRLMIKAKLLQILTLLYRYHTRVLNKERICHFSRFKKAVDYVCSNFNRSITLAECAKIAGYSPSYFSVIFHKIFGKKFCDYLSHVRIDKACRLLVSSELPIRAIAAECGMQNYANFLQIFRRTKGVTPLEYRKNVRNDCMESIKK